MNITEGYRTYLDRKVNGTTQIKKHPVKAIGKKVNLKGGDR